jgi:MFS family permease
VAFTVELGLGIVSPNLPDIMREFDVSGWQIGMIVTVFTVSRLVVDLPMAVLLERLNRIALLAAGTGLIALGSVGCGLAQDYTLLLAARLVMGLGSAFCLGTLVFSVSRASAADSRGKSIGVYQAAILGGITFSPAIGGIIGSTAGWRMAFFFGGAAATVSTLIVLATSARGLLKLSTAGPRQERRGLPPADQRPESGRIPWALVAINYTTFAFAFSMAGFRGSMMPVYGGTALGLSTATLGLLIGGGAIIRTVVTLASGIASDRIGRKIILVPGIGFLIAGTLGFILARDLTGFALSLFVLSLGGFGNSLPTTMLVDARPGRRMAWALSVNRFANDCGQFLGPVTLGLILDGAGFPLVAVATAVALASTLPGLIFAVHEKRPIRTAAPAAPGG